jgi:hypothetical protein
MAIHVECKKFDPEVGEFQYRLQFKPVMHEDEVRASVAVEVAFSISENGELADLSFMVPKSVRTQQAMAFLNEEKAVNCVDSRVFITLPPASGDTVLRAPADLELDASGRIISLNIH